MKIRMKYILEGTDNRVSCVDQERAWERLPSPANKREARIPPRDELHIRQTYVSVFVMRCGGCLRTYLLGLWERRLRRTVPVVCEITVVDVCQTVGGSGICRDDTGMAVRHPTALGVSTTTFRPVCIRQCHFTDIGQGTSGMSTRADPRYKPTKGPNPRSEAVSTGRTGSSGTARCLVDCQDRNAALSENIIECRRQ